MSTRAFIFGGSPRNVGTHGVLQTGQIVSLTDSEQASVAGNPDWAPLPVGGPATYEFVTQSGNLTGRGKVVRCSHSAPITLVLPSAPMVGDHFEIYFHTAGGGDITVSRNGKTIEGQESDLVITQEQTTAGVYWNGATWKLF